MRDAHIGHEATRSMVAGLFLREGSDVNFMGLSFILSYSYSSHIINEYTTYNSPNMDSRLGCNSR